MPIEVIAAVAVLGVGAALLVLLSAGVVGGLVASRAEARRWREIAARHGWTSEAPWRLSGSTPAGRWEFRGFFDEDTGAGDLLWRRLETPQDPEALAARGAGALTSRAGEGAVVYAIGRGGEAGAHTTAPPFAIRGFDAQWRTRADRLALAGAGDDITLSLTGPVLALTAQGGRTDMTLDAVIEFVQFGVESDAQLPRGVWQDRSPPI